MNEWIDLKTYEKILAAQAPSLLSSTEGLPDNHVITIREREISVDFTQLIQNNIKTDTVTLDLDAEWDGIHPVILFGSSEEYGVCAVDYTGDPVHVPASAMEHVGPLDLSVMGLDDSGSVRLVTIAAPGTFEVVESGEYIGEISEDDACLLGQILSALSELQELKKQLEDLISSGGGSGTTDYNALSNIPKIDDIDVKGDLSLSDFGLAPITSEEIDSLE